MSIFSQYAWEYTETAPENIHKERQVWVLTNGQKLGEILLHIVYLMWPSDFKNYCNIYRYCLLLEIKQRQYSQTNINTPTCTFYEPNSIWTSCILESLQIAKTLQRQLSPSVVNDPQATAIQTQDSLICKKEMWLHTVQKDRKK